MSRDDRQPLAFANTVNVCVYNFAARRAQRIRQRDRGAGGESFVRVMRLVNCD